MPMENDTVCVLCFDEMDMKSYKDNKHTTPTCYKLECGHAYHTKCIVECLQKTNHQCPQCNKHKNPGKTLTQEGLALQLLKEVRKTKKVKDYVREVKEAKKNFYECHDQLKKDIYNYALQRSKELGFRDKKVHLSRLMANSKKILKKEAENRGHRHAGAINVIPQWRLYESIYGMNRRKMWRFRDPYFLIRVK